MVWPCKAYSSAFLRGLHIGAKIDRTKKLHTRQNNRRPINVVHWTRSYSHLPSSIFFMRKFELLLGGCLIVPSCGGKQIKRHGKSESEWDFSNWLGCTQAAISKCSRYRICSFMDLWPTKVRPGCPPNSIFDLGKEKYKFRCRQISQGVSLPHKYIWMNRKSCSTVANRALSFATCRQS